MMDPDPGGASDKVQRRVLYGFWATVFLLVLLVLSAGAAVVYNMAVTGAVPELPQVDATQAMLALAAVGYAIYYVVNVMLVATFGATDVEQGAEMAEQTSEQAQDEEGPE